MIFLPDSKKLNIGKLSRIFDNTAECYKFFWFRAILEKVHVSKSNTFSFDELINEMILEAWYMVSEYHLNLGPRDTLERIIIRLKEISNLIPSEKRNVILAYVKSCDDTEVLKMKSMLKDEVPFRLQSPFLKDMKTPQWSRGEKDRITMINGHKHLIYYFSAFQGLGTEITIDEDWANYLRINYEIVNGWLIFNLINYLQRRNPNVPGIADKLSAPRARELNDVIKFWKLIMQFGEVREIYSNHQLTPTDLSIDHFVPWSYVANDELWNLSPTTKSINSAKSNNLPDWDTYFKGLGHIEYLSYELIHREDAVRKAFDKVAKKHLNSDEVKYRLYENTWTEEQFKNQLKEILLPVYQSAKNSGFSEWTYRV